MSANSFLTGLLGRDLQGSLSPALHNEGYRILGASGLYQPVDFSERNLQDSDLAEVISWAIRFGFWGFNVTHPFKTSILPLLDHVSADAARLGAVNTVVIRDGMTTGHNTDWLGFAAELEELTQPLHGPTLVMGAGGAGRAVIYALLQKGVTSVLLHDPDMEQAEATARHFTSSDIQLVEDIEKAANEARLVINASTVGMHGKGGLPLSEDLIRPDHMVAEVVYFPIVTPLVELAKSKGCEVTTGDLMCLHQAIAAFELMTGLTANAEDMKNFFLELTKEPST